MILIFHAIFTKKKKKKKTRKKKKSPFFFLLYQKSKNHVTAKLSGIFFDIPSFTHPSIINSSLDRFWKVTPINFSFAFLL